MLLGRRTGERVATWRHGAPVRSRRSGCAKIDNDQSIATNGRTGTFEIDNFSIQVRCSGQNSETHWRKFLIAVNAFDSISSTYFSAMTFRFANPSSYFSPTIFSMLKKTPISLAI